MDGINGAVSNAVYARNVQTGGVQGNVVSGNPAEMMKTFANEAIGKPVLEVPLSTPKIVDEKALDQKQMADSVYNALGGFVESMPPVDTVLTKKTLALRNTEKWQDQIEDKMDSIYQKAPKYAADIKKASEKYGVDPLLLTSVIAQESDFQNKANSDVGAGGLAQMMPDTAKWIGQQAKIKGFDRYNPSHAIQGAAWYLDYLSDKYDGDMTKALAAYNAGHVNVNKYKGVPPFAETQKYVLNISEMHSRLQENAIQGNPLFK